MFILQRRWWGAHWCGAGLARNARSVFRCATSARRPTGCHGGQYSGGAILHGFQLEFSGGRSGERRLGGRESGWIPGSGAGLLGFRALHAERGLAGRERGLGGAERGLVGQERRLDGRGRGLADLCSGRRPGSAGWMNGGGAWLPRSGELTLGARSGGSGAPAALRRVFKPLFSAWVSEGCGWSAVRCEQTTRNDARQGVKAFLRMCAVVP